MSFCSVKLCTLKKKTKQKFCFKCSVSIVWCVTVLSAVNSFFCNWNSVCSLCSKIKKTNTHTHSVHDSMSLFIWCVQDIFRNFHSDVSMNADGVPKAQNLQLDVWRVRTVEKETGNDVILTAVYFLSVGFINQWSKPSRNQMKVIHSGTHTRCKILYSKNTGWNMNRLTNAPPLSSVRSLLQRDISVSSESVRLLADRSLVHLNWFSHETRRLLLVEDLVDSLKVICQQVGRCFR